MLTWRYTLPAFLVPFAFVLSPNGEGLLLEGDVTWIALAFVFSAIAVGALAVTTGGWVLGPAKWPERVLCGIGGLALLYLELAWAAAGLAFIAVGMVIHLITRERGPRPPAAATQIRTPGERVPVEAAPAGSASLPDQQAPKTKDPGVRKAGPGPNEEEAV
jgi:hypothetical protein